MDPSTNYGLIVVVGLFLILLALGAYGIKVFRASDRRRARDLRRLRRDQKRTRTSVGAVAVSVEKLRRAQEQTQ